ncbi:hypothetical protein [Sandaracinus amylolyticus]|uniref:DUF7793 domain-containing protein n=1 Tax=Sandaracinus amylolyticus TaxID=927083 RepID=A0A0F6W2E0_9BACT|nr:hypothetical protein [Sandaracinus amylolyticus]AKF05750.1 hypothetical protein DB32_002899 [Sandaracinus amylolyticus]
MSLEPDVTRWALLGSTSNAHFYEIEPRVIAIVPHERSIDDERTARESVELQHAHWRARGARGGAIVFMDRLVDQRPGARKVYTSVPDPALITCFALVGGTVFGRAAASVFLGLTRPSAPTRVFATYESALEWVRSVNG